MRAVIITHVGDPCLTGLWLRFYENFWEDEVDKVYFRLNGTAMSQRIIDFYTEKFSNYPKFDFEVLKGNDHGYGIKGAVEKATEDYLMLMEDDAWVFKKGALDEQFKKLENGQFDLIGSPRVSLDMRVYEAQRKVQPDLACTDATGIGDTGTNFWPNFLFVKRGVLLKTDLEFWGKSWKKGDYIKEIDYTVEEDGAGADTGTWISIQLRNIIPPERIGLVRQNKCYPHDPILKQHRQWIFDGTPKWIHAGSISSGVNRYLIHDDAPLKDFFKPEDDKRYINLEDSELLAKDDMAMRNAFWCLCAHYSGDFAPSDFRVSYMWAISNHEHKAHLDKGEIDKRYNLYRELMGIQSWQ